MSGIMKNPYRSKVLSIDKPEFIRKMKAAHPSDEYLRELYDQIWWLGFRAAMDTQDERY